MHNSTGMLEINLITLRTAWSREEMAWLKPRKVLIKAEKYNAAFSCVYFWSSFPVLKNSDGHV